MSTDNVVLITGGSRGFGGAAARLIAERGNTVIATMRNPDRDAPEIVAGLEDRIHPVRLDVTDSAGVESVVRQVLADHGRIDVLINNAGYGLYGPIEEMSEDEIWRQFETNFIGQWRLLHAVLPSMRARGSGKIANVSSTAGRITGPMSGMYSASKHAVEAMTESLRFELHGTGVQAVIIEPGMYVSDWQTNSLDVASGGGAAQSPYQPATDRALADFRALAITRPGSRSVAVAMADIVLLEQPLPMRWPVGNDATHQLALRAAATDEQWADPAVTPYAGYGPRSGYRVDHIDPSTNADWSWATDNVVLITGGSRGFGEAAAREMASRGNTVIATMRNPDRDAPKVCRGFEDRIHPMRLDVTDAAEVRRVVDEVIARFGRIDALINNAGYGLFGPVEDCTEEEIRRQIDTNVLGQWRMLKAVLPHMRRQRYGKIVNVSSTAGRVPMPLRGFYGASKHAVEAMSEALATEVAPWGIQVSVLEPGRYASDWQTNNLDVCAALREGRSNYQAGAQRMLDEFRAQAATRPGSDAVGAAMADIIQLQQNLPLRWPIGEDAVRIIRLRQTTPDDEWERRMLAEGWGLPE